MKPRSNVWVKALALSLFGISTIYIAGQTGARAKTNRPFGDVQVLATFHSAAS